MMGELIPETGIPRWAAMWLLAVAIFTTLKIVTWSFRTVSAPPWKHLGYLVLWPGLDVDAFLGNSAAAPQRKEWAFAVLKFGLGICLLWLAVPLVSERHAYAGGWVGMAGIVFVLHFGLFHFLSCLWRRAGVAAVPIMNWPILSQGLTEFWGRRWNLAFRDLTHRFLFQPLARRIGPVNSLLTGFVMSGLVHDVVISIPANGGYGLPTLFFVLQGAGILAERSRSGRRLGLGRGLAGRVFCVALLVLPAPLLFHPPFIGRVVLPFLFALGALP